MVVDYSDWEDQRHDFSKIIELVDKVLAAGGQVRLEDLASATPPPSHPRSVDTRLRLLWATTNEGVVLPDAAAAVRDFIDQQPSVGDDDKEHAGRLLQEELAALLREHFTPVLAPFVEGGAPAPVVGEPYVFDQAVAAVFRAIGANDVASEGLKRASRRTRHGAAAVLEPFQGKQRWLQVLVSEIWARRLADDWKHRKRPAVTHELVHGMRAVLSPARRGKDLTALTTAHPEKGTVLVGDSDDEMGIWLDGPAEEFADRIAALATVTGWRLFAFVVSEAAKAWDAGTRNAPAIEIVGGYGELARVLGCSRKDTKRAVDAMHALEIHRPGGKHPLMLRDFTKGHTTKSGKKQPAKLTLIVGRPLCPGWVSEQRRKLGGKKHPLLVPISGRWPTGATRRNDHAAVYGLGMELMLTASLQAPTRAQRGEVRLPESWWEGQAEALGLSPAAVEQVRQAWLDEGILEHITGDRFALGEGLPQSARELLKEQGSLRLAAQEGGRKRPPKAARKPGKKRR